MIMRRRSLLLAIGLAAAGAAAIVVANGALMGPRDVPAVEAALLPMPTLDADGHWVEPWFRPTTGDMARDAALAESEGKFLAIFWEMEGCEFCALLHTKALRVPAVHAYVTDRFYVVRLDYRGSNDIRDFDGVTAAERDIARRHRVRGTPTLEFLTTDGEVVLRIPGYVEPSVLEAALEYVDTGAYAESNINDWLAARGLRADSRRTTK